MLNISKGAKRLYTLANCAYSLNLQSVLIIVQQIIFMP